MLEQEKVPGDSPSTQSPTPTPISRPESPDMILTFDTSVGDWQQPISLCESINPDKQADVPTLESTTSQQKDALPVLFDQLERKFPAVYSSVHSELPLKEVQVTQQESSSNLLKHISKLAEEKIAIAKPSVLECALASGDVNRELKNPSTLHNKDQDPPLIAKYPESRVSVLDINTLTVLDKNSNKKLSGQQDKLDQSLQKASETMKKVIVKTTGSLPDEVVLINKPETSFTQQLDGKNLQQPSKLLFSLKKVEKHPNEQIVAQRPIHSLKLPPILPKIGKFSNPPVSISKVQQSSNPPVSIQKVQQSSNTPVSIQKIQQSLNTPVLIQKIQQSPNTTVSIQKIQPSSNTPVTIQQKIQQSSNPPASIQKFQQSSNTPVSIQQKIQLSSNPPVLNHNPQQSTNQTVIVLRHPQSLNKRDLILKIQQSSNQPVEIQKPRHSSYKTVVETTPQSPIQLNLIQKHQPSSNQPVLIQKPQPPLKQSILIQNLLKPSNQPFLTQKLHQPSSQPFLNQKLQQHSNQPFFTQKLQQPSNRPVLTQKFQQPSNRPVLTQKFQQPSNQSFEVKKVQHSLDQHVLLSNLIQSVKKPVILKQSLATPVSSPKIQQSSKQFVSLQEAEMTSNHSTTMDNQKPALLHSLINTKTLPKQDVPKNRGIHLAGYNKDTKHFYSFDDTVNTGEVYHDTVNTGEVYHDTVNTGEVYHDTVNTGEVYHETEHSYSVSSLQANENMQYSCTQNFSSQIDNEVKDHAKSKFSPIQNNDSLSTDKSSEIVTMYRNGEEVMILQPEPLGHSSPPCELRIESVYSLAPGCNNEVSDIDDVVMSDLISSSESVQIEEDDQFECQTFSLKYSTWQDYIKPCFVVLERLSSEAGNETLDSRCSSYCRYRTLRLLCELNLLDCGCANKIESAISDIKGNESAIGVTKGNKSAIGDTKGNENSIGDSKENGSAVGDTIENESAIGDTKEDESSVGDTKDDRSVVNGMKENESVFTDMKEDDSVDPNTKKYKRCIYNRKKYKSVVSNKKKYKSVFRNMKKDESAISDMQKKDKNVSHEGNKNHTALTQAISKEEGVISHATVHNKRVTNLSSTKDENAISDVNTSSKGETEISNTSTKEDGALNQTLQKTKTKSAKNISSKDKSTIVHANHKDESAFSLLKKGGDSESTYKHKNNDKNNLITLKDHKNSLTLSQQVKTSENKSVLQAMEKAQVNRIPGNLYDVVKSSGMRRKAALTSLSSPSDSDAKKSKSSRTGSPMSSRKNKLEDPLFESLNLLKEQVASKREENKIRKLSRTEKLNQKVVRNNGQSRSNRKKIASKVDTKIPKRKSKEKEIRHGFDKVGGDFYCNPLPIDEFDATTDLEQAPESVDSQKSLTRTSRQPHVQLSASKNQGVTTTTTMQKALLSNTINPDRSSPNGLENHLLIETDHTLSTNPPYSVSATGTNSRIPASPRLPKSVNPRDTNLPQSVTPTPRKTNLPQSLSPRGTNLPQSVSPRGTNLPNTASLNSPKSVTPRDINPPNYVDTRDTNILNPELTNVKSTTNLTDQNIPHKAFSVCRSGTKQYLVPSSSYEPVSPTKLKAALETLSKGIEKNPNARNPDGSNYFLIKIDNQHFVIKTGRLPAPNQDSSQPGQSVRFVMMPTTQPSLQGHNPSTTQASFQAHTLSTTQSQGHNPATTQPSLNPPTTHATQQGQKPPTLCTTTQNQQQSKPTSSCAQTKRPRFKPFTASTYSESYNPLASNSSTSDCVTRTNLKTTPSFQFVLNGPSHSQNTASPGNDVTITRDKTLSSFFNLNSLIPRSSKTSTISHDNSSFIPINVSRDSAPPKTTTLSPPPPKRSHPPSSPTSVVAEIKRRKRQKLEAKYPLPDGVVIKSEPLTVGYELDNNWSVASEIDMGYSQSGCLDPSMEIDMGYSQSECLDPSMEIEDTMASGFGSSSVTQSSPQSVSVTSENVRGDNMMSKEMGGASMTVNMDCDWSNDSLFTKRGGALLVDEMTEDLPPVLQPVSDNYKHSPDKNRTSINSSFDREKSPPLLQHVLPLPSSPPPSSTSSTLTASPSCPTSPPPPPLSPSPTLPVISSPPPLLSPSPPLQSSSLFVSLRQPIHPSLAANDVFSMDEDPFRRKTPLPPPSSSSPPPPPPPTQSCAPLPSSSIATISTSVFKSKSENIHYSMSRPSTSPDPDTDSGLDPVTSSPPFPSFPTPVPAAKTKIQQLKELLKKKELQVDNYLRIQSKLPQVDLDSV